MSKIPEIKQEIDIPPDISIEIDDTNTLKVTGPKGALQRTLDHPSIEIKKSGNKIEIICILPKKKEKALVGTFTSHIKNMIQGVTTGFEYKMKIVYAHFPIKTTLQDKQILIDNFLGEKYPRKAIIYGDTSVEIKGDEIILAGIDIEQVSQTAANIERATRVKKRDRRVFQDGIYITNKGN